MGLKVGFCGCGRFGRCFIPLFKAHPNTDQIVLADLIAERVVESAKEHNIAQTMDSLDDLCKSDVDVICIFTQRHLHGPQILQALKAGKHVYSAVPTGLSVDELGAIVDTVEKTGQVFMTGETSYYYPSTLYVRQRFNNGDFGKFAYAEAAYYHDMDHFYASFQHSGGPDWKTYAGIPPMYYPTHSTSMILSVTGARAASVSCLGMVDDHEDGIFRVGANRWDNTFSNESALMRTTDGGVIRVNEMRRVGWFGGNSVQMRFYGTEATFEEHATRLVYLTKATRAEDIEDVTEKLTCKPMVGHEHLGGNVEDLGEEFFTGLTEVHPVNELPDSFRGLPNGHYGSHQFLVNDFLNAAAVGKQPAHCHVWDAAAWNAPGIVAHESAKKEGEIMPVPDFGDAKI